MLAANIAIIAESSADMLFTAAPTALPHVKNGKVRLLGDSGTHAYPAMPGVPTVAEAGKLKCYAFNI